MYDPSQHSRVQYVSQIQEFCCERAGDIGLLSFLSQETAGRQDGWLRFSCRGGTAGPDGTARARSAKVEGITERSVTIAAARSRRGSRRGGHANAGGIQYRKSTL